MDLAGYIYIYIIYIYILDILDIYIYIYYKENMVDEGTHGDLTNNILY